MRRIALLLLCASLSACAGYLLGDRKPAPTLTPEGGSQTSVRDNAISGEIRRKFNEDSELSQYAIGVFTDAGRVRLSGAVGSYDARDRAVGIARSTNGVRDVDNRMIVNTNL